MRYCHLLLVMSNCEGDVFLGDGMHTKNFEDFEKALGKCVRDLRLGTGVTQAEFAKRSQHLRQSTVAKFESGSTPNVTLRTIYEVAKAGHIPVSELIKKAEGVGDLHEETWDDVIRDVNLLTHEKRDWLGKVIRNVLKGEK